MVTSCGITASAVITASSYPIRTVLPSLFSHYSNITQFPPLVYTAITWHDLSS